MKTFNYEEFKDCYFRKSKYQMGNMIYLGIVSDEEGPIMDVTVNLSESVILKPDEVTIKDYSENKGILAFMQQMGFAGEVLWYCPSGFILAPVVKLNLDKIAEYCK